MGVNDREYNAQSEQRARAAAKKAAKPAYDGWKAFVALELTQSMKEAYKAWLVEDDIIWVWLDARLAGGYKLSLSFDTYNSSYIASLTCRSASDRNQGLTLTARGGEWFKALRVLSWKDSVFLEHVWDNVPVGHPRSTDDIG